MTMFEIINLIKQGESPELLTKRIVEERFGATPMGANLLSLIKNRQFGDIEKIARNMTAARGGDFDQFLIGCFFIANFRRNRKCSTTQQADIVYPTLLL